MIETRADAPDPTGVAPLGGRAWRLAGTLAAVGLAGFAAAAWMATTDPSARARLWPAYLVQLAFFLSLALGGLFFVMVTHLSRAGWSVTLRRMAEVAATPLALLGVLALPVILARHELYEWSHAARLARDPLLAHKAAYLDPSFFLARLLIYFAVWIGLSRYFLWRSSQQDRDADPRRTLEMEAASAPGLVAFGLTVTFAAFDWLMSLRPHWYSTIFGVYYFAGCAVGAFALLIVASYLFQRSGRLQGWVTLEHYHDLGKFLFGFIVFWAYIAFSQYMLIWYANLPEETVWYYVRQRHGWLWVSLALIFGHFFVPFLWLMSRHPKRRPAALFAAALWALVFHWLDIYWLVMPEFEPERAAVQGVDAALLVGFAGLYAATVLVHLRGRALVPVGDPRLGESLEAEHA